MKSITTTEITFKTKEQLKKELVESVKKLAKHKQAIEKIFQNQQSFWKQNVNKFTYAKWAGMGIKTIGGASTISGAVSKTLLPKDSQEGNTAFTTGQVVGGVFTFILGQGIEYYASEGEKSYQGDLNKYLKDLNDLKENWNGLIDTIGKNDLYPLYQKTKTNLPADVEKPLKDLFESRNGLKNVKKNIMKEESNINLEEVDRWLSTPISDAVSPKEKIETSGEHCQLLQKIWQRWDIKERIDELKIQVNNYQEINWDESNETSDSQDLAEANSSAMNNNNIIKEQIIEELPKRCIL